MKLVRLVLIFAVVSFALSGLMFYLGDGVIQASWGAKFGEMGVMAIIIFIFLIIIYSIAKAMVRGTMAARKKRNKKSLPNQEGPNAG